MWPTPCTHACRGADGACRGRQTGSAVGGAWRGGRTRGGEGPRSSVSCVTQNRPLQLMCSHAAHSAVSCVSRGGSQREGTRLWPEHSPHALYIRYSPCRAVPCRACRVLPVRGQCPIGTSRALQLGIVVLEVSPPEQIVAGQAFAESAADKRAPTAVLGREATASEKAIQKGVMGLRQVRVTKRKDPHLKTRQRHCSPRSNSPVSSMPAGPQSGTQTVRNFLSGPSDCPYPVHVQPHQTSTRRAAKLIRLGNSIYNGDCTRIGRWL